MREIKFRVWETAQKCWFDPSTIAVTGLGYLKTYRDYDWRAAQESAIVMQWTGLKDKNRKEIYEGDVVRGVVKFPQLLTWQTDDNSNFKMGGVVQWDLVGFTLRAIQSMCDPEREGMANYFAFVGSECETFEELEVIGNIYENPDLLQ